MATVLLLVLGEHAATLALERLVHLHLRDFMLPTMGGTLRMLLLMVAVVDHEDPALADVLRGYVHSCWSKFIAQRYDSASHSNVAQERLTHTLP